MTPEERADEVCRLFGIPRRPEQDRGSEWGPRLCARIAKAIRCAEDEALERAAATFDELPGFSSFPSDNESAMRVVRACAAQVGGGSVSISDPRRLACRSP